jgi:hypothetical protein
VSDATLELSRGLIWNFSPKGFDLILGLALDSSNLVTGASLGDDQLIDFEVDGGLGPTLLIEHHLSERDCKDRQDQCQDIDRLLPAYDKPRGAKYCDNQDGKRVPGQSGDSITKLATDQVEASGQSHGCAPATLDDVAL